jgi:hypothetical protein
MPRKGTSVAAQKRQRAQDKAAEVKRRSDANPRRSLNGRAKVTSVAAATRRWDPVSTDWGSPEFGAEATRIAQTGRTMKEVTADMGLPAETKYWRYVSLAVRAWKDAHGIERPGRRSEVPTAAPTNGKGERRKKSEPARHKVSLAEMSDDEVTAAIEGRTVTYNYSATPGTDEAFVAKVKKYDLGRKDERVVTFWDHVSPPTAAEVKAEAARAREEKRDPRELPEHADGNIRSLYVHQIVSIGKRR